MRDGEFPFILTTGRVLEHYNWGTMTRRTGNARIVTEDVLAIHPADAARKQITTGDLVRIFSARGEVRIHAKVSDEVNPGILYTTFHFPEHLVNVVTSSECDEDTMCPQIQSRRRGRGASQCAGGKEGRAAGYGRGEVV